MTQEGHKGRFGQQCGHCLSGGADTVSPMPALAIGHVELSKRASPSLPHPSALALESRIWQEALQGCLAPSAPPCPAKASQGRKTALRSHLTPLWDQGEDQELPTFTIAFGLAAEILLYHSSAVGGRRRGSVPGLAAKLSSGLHGEGKHMRCSGPAW